MKNNESKNYKKCKIIFTDNVPELELRCIITTPNKLGKILQKQYKRDEKEFKRVKKELEDR